MFLFLFLFNQWPNVKVYFREKRGKNSRAHSKVCFSYFSHRFCICIIFKSLSTV